MKPVAVSEDVSIHCPAEGRYSLFNSPYPGHKLQTGIDIYPSLAFGGPSPSPVSGEVKEVRRVKAPKGRGFADAGYDVVTLITPDDNRGAVVKLLHVDTALPVGETVEAGDDLGKLLRSGYYGWGTSPHIHLEVRDPSDPLRARGGHQMRTLTDLGSVSPTEEIVGEVIWTQPEYALVRLNDSGYGLAGEVDGAAGVLDGGIPYYGWLGVHADSPTSGEVRLLGRAIADVKEVRSRACVAECRRFHFTADGQRLLGLSLYLTPRPEPIVKILPQRIGALSLREGDVAEVQLATG